ncbi:MAG: hypothetical protein WCK35_28890, partial [Chloroflexota bacterium]
LDPTAQQLPIQALAGAGLTNISLWVDDQQIATFTTPPYLTWWLLNPGTHHFWAQALTSSGQTIRTDPVEIIVTK